MARIKINQKNNAALRRIRETEEGIRREFMREDCEIKQPKDSFDYMTMGEGYRIVRGYNLLARSERGWEYE